MAEFVAVMKEYRRMCDKNVCEECTLYRENNPANFECVEFMEAYPEEAEKIIMNWAKAHPEEKYPSWKRWLDENFSSGRGPNWFTPCVFDISLVKECDDNCTHCLQRLIPANIAEKLHILPIKPCPHVERRAEGDYCRGSREIDPCPCGGDMNKCSRVTK